MAAHCLLKPSCCGSRGRSPSNSKSGFGTSLIILHPSLHDVKTDKNGWVAGDVGARVKHRFQLNKSTIFLYLNSNLAYDEVKKLLLAIESGHFTVDEKNPWFVREDKNGATVLWTPKISIDRISSVRGHVNENNQTTYTIMTYHSDTGGSSYTFAKLGSTYVLVSEGFWVVDNTRPETRVIARQ